MEHVADRALGVGNNQVERGGVHLVGGKFVAPQDEPHLWTIPMGDDDRPPLGNHFGNVCRGLSHSIPLIAHSHMRFVFDE